MTVGDGLEGGFEICEGLDAVDLCGLDERCDAAPGTPTFVMSGKQRVFPVESDGPDQVLDAVGIDLDPSIVQEGLQPAPVPMDVGKLFPQARLGGDAQALLAQPFPEG